MQNGLRLGNPYDCHTDECKENTWIDDATNNDPRNVETSSNDTGKRCAR